MPYTTCPSCDKEMPISGRPKMGDTVTCGSCGSEFEVVNTNPLELDWAEKEYDDEDWDWEEDEDQDY